MTSVLVPVLSPRRGLESASFTSTEDSDDGISSLDESGSSPKELDGVLPPTTEPAFEGALTFDGSAGCLQYGHVSPPWTPEKWTSQREQYILVFCETRANRARARRVACPWDFRERLLYPDAMNENAPKIRLVDLDAVIHDVHTRMPFRYGIACLTSAPSLHVRLTIEDEGGRIAHGIAADGLPPRWFDKNPERTFRQNVEDQISAMQTARDVFLEGGKDARSAAAHWEAAFPRIHATCADAGLNGLTASFGSSFLERAMLDALSRLHELSFFDMLKKDLTGLETSRYLPERPLERLGCRHTIGLADPITRDDILPEDKLDDALPQSLDECIDYYGLYCFKVKVRGDHDEDVARLGAIARCFQERCKRPYLVTLDGNEQYRDMSQLIELIDAIRGLPSGEAFIDSVIFIEQPLSRDLALEPSAASGIRELAAVKPVIIDESDDSLESFQKAIELGYRGVSHKNCKGIFKSLLNRERVVRLNAEAGEERYFQSAEDLANLPVIPLQEDLTTIAALGIPHVERNGHHYFHGLDHVPSAEAEAALAAHPDLYHRVGDSICLKIENGDLSCASLQCVGFGYGGEIALDERVPLADWKLPD